MGETWNKGFNKTLPKGTAGNQAYEGLFYKDARAWWRRLVEATGHEKSFNPETEEINPIGQEAAETLVRSFNESFGKDIIIKKGALNYEFFRKWLDMRPTGDNAKLPVCAVDFMQEEKGDKHYNYYAYTFMATVTVDSGNFTDGSLTVNFTQAGDRTIGIISRIDDSTSDDERDYEYKFTPYTEIDITAVNVSDAEFTMKAGNEKMAEVSISPLGSSQDFTVEADDPTICRVERLRQSVVIRALKDGTAKITVQSTEDPSKEAVIDITVGEAGGETNVPVTGITLNQSALVLDIGDTAKLTATVSPSNATNKNVTWESSGESVVTVDGGLVTAVGDGVAVITVITEDGNKFAICAVKVQEAASSIIPVTSVTLDQSVITLDIGETETLTETVLPSDATNQNVSWTSSNESIATVDNGEVTAIGAGFAIITVVTEDGNKFANCAVTAAEAVPGVVPVTGVTLDETTLTMDIGETAVLTATVEPDNASDQTVEWSSDDENVATVNDDGVVTAIDAGEAVITVTTVDGNMTASCAVTVTND